MNYKALFVDADNYYSIGIDQDSGQYAMEVVITWIAWYRIYFSLSDEEVALFQQDHHALRDLSFRFAQDKGQALYKSRLLLNEGPKQ